VLVIKTEIWPGGDVDRAYEISRIGICNVSKLAPISDYEMTALTHCDTRDEKVSKMEINKHERALGWEPLARRAITGLFMPDLLVPGPYDDPVAQLLRKDPYARRTLRDA
jgi:hypothetical protein